MSRYVRLDLDVRDLTRDELRAALAALDLSVEVAELPGGLMLQGNFECAGEPVDLRLADGVLGAAGDFGLRAVAGGFVLVCGEHDRALLADHLLVPLVREVGAARVRAAAAAAGLDVDAQVAADGTLRLKLRPSG